MWRFKQFMPKEQAGLEGRTIDVGNLKVLLRNVIAEGGFSCVYFARDVVHISKQYAVKHIICNDEESLDLVKKEISVMKLLKGHPNVVDLVAYTILDMGRTKEALLVMEFCDKSLVSVLDSRGAGYFEEKQVLGIFRDVCNAVFAMHSLSPPIAHRDLKAENLLLGPDGLWKLCDFGSTSTNHKRFERPEEMGIEEDNIRKHTTPAYRAPEMWDLFRRELINEKVDIWALGCLLFRICYLKSAFDGESKLQILNGNYRIPELPKYHSSITDLIKDMLHGSPDARPDITQVWFRVNGLLPEELQKSLPDRSADMHLPTSDIPDGGISNSARKSAPMPRRSPPPPPSKEPVRTSVTSEAGGGPLGAFWSSQHVNDLLVTEEKVGAVHDESRSRNLLKHDKKQSPENSRRPENGGFQPEQSGQVNSRSAHGSSLKSDNPSEDFELRFSSDDRNRGSEKTKVLQPVSKFSSQNEAFNTFVADFDTGKLDSVNSNMKSPKEQALEAEVDRLKEQLKLVNSEKDEMTSKYEKLSAICRSQRQEIQELKQTLAVESPSPNRDASKKHNTSPACQPREKIEGTVLELQKGMFDNSSPAPGSGQWKAFSDEAKSQPKSVRTTNGNKNKNVPPVSPSQDSWGFGTDNFTAVSTGSHIARAPALRNNSKQLSDSKNVQGKQASQPAGWSGF